MCNLSVLAYNRNLLSLAWFACPIQVCKELSYIVSVYTPVSQSETLNHLYSSKRITV